MGVQPPSPVVLIRFLLSPLFPHNLDRQGGFTGASLVPDLVLVAFPQILQVDLLSRYPFNIGLLTYPDHFLPRLSLPLIFVGDRSLTHAADHGFRFPNFYLFSLLLLSSYGLNSR